MIRLLRWLVLLLALGALGFLLVKVPIGGRTLWERVAGAGEKPPAPAPVVAPNQPAPPDADSLTEKDRRQLDRLIETKLNEKSKARP